MALCARAVRGLTALLQNEKITVHNRACLEHLQANHSLYRCLRPAQRETGLTRESLVRDETFSTVLASASTDKLL